VTSLLPHLHLATTKRLVNGLSLVPILVLVLAAEGLAQLPEAPQPTMSAVGSCPADARFDFDVSSIPNADRVRWQIHRAAPSQNFGSPEVDSGTEQGTSGSIERDLRAYGPVLDGTRYSFRVRARQGGDDVSAFSPRVIFELDLSPDPPTPALNMPPGSLSLDWGLTGAIAACADRVVFRIDKADGSATIQSVESGVSGTKTADLTAQGPGDYDVRIHARHDGDTAEDAVGRESAPRRVALQTRPELSIDDLSFPEGIASNTQNAIVRLSAPAQQPVSVLIGALPGGTATEGACGAGRDVTFTFRTVTIDPKQTQVTVPFTLCGDTVFEDPESFTLGLLNPVNATIRKERGVVTVLNDDAPTPPAPLNVSIRDAPFTEGNNTNTQFARVSLSAPTSQTVTVLMGARPGGTATEGNIAIATEGSCAAGRDFTFAFRSVSINPQQTELDVPFTVCGDTAFENDETFSLGLTSAVNAALGDSVGNMTIRNDDANVQAPTPALPNLQVVIDESPQFETQLGPPLVHVITVTNSGAGAASNVVVQSTLPRDVRFLRIEENQFDGCTGGVITDAATGQALVRCSASSLPAGSSRSVRIVGEIAGSVADGTRVVFGANADPFKAVSEANEADNFAFLSTIVRFPADLRIAKVALDTLNISRPFGGIRGLIEGAGADFIFHYTWTVTNNGPPASPPTTLRIQWPTAGIQVFGGDGNVIPLTEEVPIPALVPNASSVVARTVKLRTVTGEPRAASVSVTVDPDHIFDSFVSNNTFTLLVILQ
jgi:uncharacterized repeat protein (TIGR01451 family)